MDGSATDIPDGVEFERLRRNLGRSLRLARNICENHHLSNDCLRVADRSQLVFSSGDNHIIKVFSPEDADFHKTETVFLSHLYQRLPIHTPELVASGYQEGLPYIVMEKLHGLPLDRVWSELPAGEQRRLVVLLGEAVHALHSLPVEPFRAAPFQWDPFIDRRLEALLNNHRRYGLDKKWLGQLGNYIDDCPIDPHNPDLLVPLHTELMQEHIFVDKEGPRWALSGLIDFEPSMVGNAEYEFCAVGLFVTRGNTGLFRLFLSAYGYHETDLTEGLSRRIMWLLLLHRYSNLKWFLTLLPPGAHFTRLAELEQYWYGV